MVQAATLLLREDATPVVFPRLARPVSLPAARSVYWHEATSFASIFPDAGSGGQMVMSGQLPSSGRAHEALLRTPALLHH
jgi:hypothetical protein